jgi:GNAT superfamily N-acetyltransferase
LVNSAGAAALEDMVAATSGRQDRLVVVGTTDEAEVGFLSAHCERTRHQLIGVIDAIYVEPSARLVGVGDAMINLVVEWCAGRGCAGVDAPALPGSRPAKAFLRATAL